MIQKLVLAGVGSLRAGSLSLACFPLRRSTGSSRAVRSLAQFPIFVSHEGIAKLTKRDNFSGVDFFNLVFAPKNFVFRVSFAIPSNVKENRWMVGENLI